jgi:ApaG protein
MGSVSETTEGVRIDVTSWYAPERSSPVRNLWFFVYSIRIENTGRAPVTLRRRHWIITNAEGEVQEVEGEGVVGEQPTLTPGEVFEYTSACTLSTPFGTMRGTYRMERENLENFEATIPMFRLAQPHAVN